jgi:hypothetical protein
LGIQVAQSNRKQLIPTCQTPISKKGADESRNASEDLPAPHQIQYGMKERENPKRDPAKEPDPSAIITRLHPIGQTSQGGVRFPMPSSVFT